MVCVADVDCMTGVEYRPVVGFPGYRVGDDGSVWTCWMPRKRFMVNVWQQLKPGVDKGKRSDSSTARPPYKRVVLTRESDHKRVTCKVHRLVLEAFVGPCPDGMECRHLDGDHGNNRRSNLEWGTKPANWADKRTHGSATVGERSGKTYFTAEQVLEIRRLYALGVKPKALKEQFNARKIGCIYGIVYRSNWKHV
jgi:hypothetical protein